MFTNPDTFQLIGNYLESNAGVVKWSSVALSIVASDGDFSGDLLFLILIYLLLIYYNLIIIHLPFYSFIYPKSYFMDKRIH